MHHRSGSRVKGHYRNGTWIAGHNRKGTCVSDYTKHFFSNTSAVNKGMVSISQRNYSSSTANQSIIVSISEKNYSSSGKLVNVSHLDQEYNFLKKFFRLESTPFSKDIRYKYIDNKIKKVIFTHFSELMVKKLENKSNFDFISYLEKYIIDNIETELLEIKDVANFYTKLKDILQIVYILILCEIDPYYKILYISNKEKTKAEKQNKSDLIFRIYGIDNNTIGYTVDCDLDDRADIKKLYETSLSPVNIRKLLFRIDERFNHNMPTNISEFQKQALLRKHWHSVVQLSKEICTEIKIKKAEKQNKSDLIFRIYGIDNNTIGYTVDCDLDDRADIKILYETSLSPVNIKKLLFRIDERFNHNMPTYILEFQKQALLRKHWHSVVQLSEEVCTGKKKHVNDNK